MDSNATKQTMQRLRPGAVVMLNMGLSGYNFVKGTGRSMASILHTYTANLRSIMQPGYRCEVQLAADEDDEHTLVVVGRFSMDVCDTDRVWYMVQLAQQDCISIWYPEPGEGMLFGPNHEEWEPFDAAKFKTPIHRTVIQ